VAVVVVVVVVGREVVEKVVGNGKSKSLGEC
jgi:hypothetical protein